MKKGDKVKFIGDPMGELDFGKIYTYDHEIHWLGKVHVFLKEFGRSFPIEDFELVESSPENPDTITVKKIDEIHITIGEVTHHLTRVEAKELYDKLEEVV